MCAAYVAAGAPLAHTFGSGFRSHSGDGGRAFVGDEVGLVDCHIEPQESVACDAALR